jgi:transcriptional regulator with XRE-family HTH domain
LSLEETARLAGISAGHLSRLERGERTGLSRKLLAQLTAILAVDPIELYGAAGQLPARIEQALANPDLALALMDGQSVPFRTRWMLRRRHLSVLAESTFGAPPAGRVDVDRLLRGRGYTVRSRRDVDGQLKISRGTVSIMDGPVDRRRLLLGHALAHSVLQREPSCLLDMHDRTPEQEDQEAEATALGSCILVPTTTLAVAVRDESSRYDVWAGQTGDFLEALAGRFGVPAWVIARRVSEESLFVDATHLEDM